MIIDPSVIYVRENFRRFVRELKDFIRFPSVSAQPQHASDVRACARWLGAHLKQIGIEQVQMVETAGYPIIFGRWCHLPGRTSLLIYGHYDVQPAEPLHEWCSPPFEPKVRGDNLYGRGACDDKGQLFAHLKAIEACLRTHRTLPVNVKCLFEGEEEIGSPSLTSFLTRHREVLAADAAVVSDMRVLGPDRPAITYALRGALSVELKVLGPGHDLHSGNFGGAVHNPLQALCEIIAHLHDAEGRVAIPGFYHRVRQWSLRERAYMAETGPSDEQILRDAAAESGWGEEGYSLYERLTLRPALTINGIVGGYQGPGAKAVIPAKAAAKLNFRLVPDQDPREIGTLFRQHIARITPSTVRTEVRTSASAEPALVSRQHPAVQAAARAYRKSFGRPPVFLRSGGTIPIVNTLSEVLQIPTVLMGFALPDDNLHAPNEKFHLPTFFKAIRTCLEFLNQLGGVAQEYDQASATCSFTHGI
jgi:acetylornithine deacetylase/succinyl-diaminopimelate desuccinylase-like protein